MISNVLFSGDKVQCYEKALKEVWVRVHGRMWYKVDFRFFFLFKMSVLFSACWSIYLLIALFSSENFKILRAITCYAKMLIDLTQACCQPSITSVKGRIWQAILKNYLFLSPVLWDTLLWCRNMECKPHW